MSRYKTNKHRQIILLAIAIFTIFYKDK